MSPHPARVFKPVAELACDLDRARVYEHGWQSWSPSGVYPALGTSPRPRLAHTPIMGFRSGSPPPAQGFQGEGLLAVDPGDGSSVTVFSAPRPREQTASLRAQPLHGRLAVSADGPVRSWVAAEGASLVDALVAWADQAAAEAGGPVALRNIPAMWCSWYCYWRDVTNADVRSALAGIERHQLPIGVVQVDDGWQAGLGDWDRVRPAFGDLGGLAKAIGDSGRKAGIWVAPFLVGAESTLAQEHPDWIVGDADAGFNWNQHMGVLDVTHPGAAEYLSSCLSGLAALGFDLFKLDFLYAGAIAGHRHQDCSPLEAYQEGLRVIHEALGPDPTLLGCGAPLLPSVGWFHAMRVSPDIGPAYEPPEGDLSYPAGRSAALANRARAFQHGRLWVNDPDCLLARPQVERREAWAALLAALPGTLASISDPPEALDHWGLETARRILRPARPEPLLADLDRLLAGVPPAGAPQVC